MTSAPDTLARPAFALVWLYSMLTTLAWAALLPVLPLYVRGPLDGGDIAVGAVMSAAVLVAALAQPLLGRRADRRGRRGLLVGGPIFSSRAFVVLFSVADAPLGLFGLRTAAEIGQAAAVIGAITVVNDLAPDARRGEAYSIYSLSSWAGVGLGPVLGDLVLRAGSYNAVWLVSGGLALAGAVLAFALPETRRPEQQQRRASARFLNRSALLPGSILACEMFALAALMVFSALYARQLGMAGAGLVLLTNAAVLVSIRIFGRRLPDRLGVRRATTIGVLLRRGRTRRSPRSSLTPGVST